VSASTTQCFQLPPVCWTNADWPCSCKSSRSQTPMTLKPRPPSKRLKQSAAPRRHPAPPPSRRQLSRSSFADAVAAERRYVGQRGMMASDRDTAEVLVRRFLSSAPASFGYVVNAPGYRGRTALQQATARGLVDVAPDGITTWFWATWRFDTAQLSGEVRFGDREYALSVVVAPAGAALEFELWEWAQIDRAGPSLTSGDGQFCDSVDRLQRELDRYSKVLAELFDQIALGRTSDLTLLARARSARQDAWRARLREDQQARASAQADEAFRAGDYSRVIELLSPFESTLTASGRTKVALARRKAQSEPG
jgi:hypothetical protein